jgi:leucyl aminopeptidase (aminopeptidase T)
MDSSEFVQWLKGEGLFPQVEKHYPVFMQIFQQCLGVRKEYVLIIGDMGYHNHQVAALMAGCYLLAAKRLGLKYELVIQQPKKVHSSADDLLIQALREFNESNVLVLAISGKLGSMKVLGKSFRRYAREQGHRFASTVSLQDLETSKFSALIKALTVDYNKINANGLAIKQRLDNGNELRITTAAGTDLTVDIRSKFAVANTGIFTTSRLGGNLPAGEVYIAPRGKGVNGKIVIDISAKVRQSTVLVKTPIALTVKDGLLTKVSGGHEAELLEATLKWAERIAQYPWGVRRIGEVGIGINDRADIIGPTIVNEKALGTAHIAIGSNVWFGGTVYAVTHFDQVFRNPTIYIDGQRLVI